MKAGHLNKVPRFHLQKKIGGSRVEYTLIDGRKVELTITYAHLYRLKAKRPMDYKKFNHVYTSVEKKEDYDIFLTPLRTIYTGYLCGMIEKGEIDQAINFEEFIALTEFDINKNTRVMKDLIYPKKRTASEKPSAKPEASEENAE